MEVVFLLSALAAFFSFMIVLIYLAQELSKFSIKKKDAPLLVIAAVYLSFSIILFFISTGFLQYGLNELSILYFFKILLESLSISAVLFYLSRKHFAFISYLVLVFLSPLIFFDPSKFHVLIPTTLLVFLVSFFSLSKYHKTLMETPLFYIISSAALYFLALIFQSAVPFAILFSNIAFFAFLIKYLHRLKALPEIPDPIRIKNPAIVFLKHLIFLITFANFIFIGTIGLHEAGHVFASKILSCKKTQVILDLANAPHTLSECSEKLTEFLLLGGVLLPVAVAALLLFSGGKFIKETSFQIFSMNLILSYRDFIDLGVPQTLSISILIFGISLTLFSLGILAYSRTSP